MRMILALFVVSLLAYSCSAVDFTCPTTVVTRNTASREFPVGGSTLFPTNYTCTIEFQIPVGQVLKLGTQNNLLFDLDVGSLMIQDSASTQYLLYVLDTVFYAPATNATLTITTHTNTSSFYITWEYVDVTGFTKIQKPTGSIFPLNLTLNNYYQFTSPKSQVAFHTGSIKGDNDLSIYRIYVYDGEDLSAKFLGNLYEFTKNAMVSSGKSLTLVNYYNTTPPSYGIANDYSAISIYEDYGFYILSTSFRFFLSQNVSVGKESVFTVFCYDCQYGYLSDITFRKNTTGQEVRVRPMTPTDGYYANLLTYNIRDPVDSRLPQQIATNLFTISTYQADIYITIMTESYGWQKVVPGRTGSIVSPSLWNPKTVLTPAYFTNITSTQKVKFAFNLKSVTITAIGEKVRVEVGSSESTPSAVELDHSTSNTEQIYEGTYMATSFSGLTSRSSFVMDFSIEMKYLSIFVLISIAFGAMANTQCGENEIFNECGSPCDRTCAEPFPTCIEMCQARCECKPNFVIHPTTKKCVNLKKCPK